MISIIYYIFGFVGTIVNITGTTPLTTSSATSIQATGKYRTVCKSV
jgi:hypothetical protein